MRLHLYALLLFGLLAACLLAGCSPSETRGAAASEPESAARSADRTTLVPIDPTTAGRLRVIVELDGEAPQPRQLDVGREPACEHDGPIYSEFVVVADGKLAGALVRVTGGHEGWLPPAPTEIPARLRQSGCTYRPHVLAIEVGTPLLIENDDELLHNVHVLARKNPTSNQVQTPGAAALRFEFRRPELSIPVQCDIHPWMGAWLHVVEHPWFAVTDETGVARIADLPPGDYQLEVLHEKYGTRSLTAHVEAGGELELRVSFTP